MSLITTIQTITSICERYKIQSKESGEDYNIFKIINLTTNEVRIHSTFIAHLLNPKESHGYGTAFLELFLEGLKTEELKIDDFDVADFDVASAKVQVERYIGPIDGDTGGRLDIDIWDKNHYHIIIENKIYAGDQDKQMVRYYNYAKSCEGGYKLFYLTLDESTPNEDLSCVAEDKSRLEVGEDYNLLSYAFDIKKWLEACRDKAENIPLVREGISHYLNLINYLTNQTMNASFLNEVKSELIKNENVPNLAFLKQSIVGAEKELQLKFWRALVAKFKEGDRYSVSQPYFETAIEGSLYPIKHDGIDIVIEGYPLTYSVALGDELFSGFKISKDDHTSIHKEEYYAILRDRIEKLKLGYQSDGDWLGWKYQQPALNFINMNEETCKHLANIRATVETMFTNMEGDIKAFLGEY